MKLNLYFIILHIHRLDCWSVKLVNVIPNCAKNQDGFAEQLKRLLSLFFEDNCCALAETATNTVCQKLWIILPNYLGNDRMSGEQQLLWRRGLSFGLALAGSSYNMHS